MPQTSLEVNNGPTHALSGAGWTLLTYAAPRAIGVVSTLVLGHLLRPSDFGVVAIALIVVSVTATAARLGIPSAVVLSELDEPTLRAIAGALLLTSAMCACAIAITGLLLGAFRESLLAWVLAALAPTLVLSAWASLHEALLQRAIAFRRRFAGYLAQAVVTAAVGIPVALASGGVWSLVSGYVAGQLAYSVVLTRSITMQIVPTLDLSPIRRLARVSGGFLAADLLEFARNNVDVGTSALVLGARATGLYSLAFRLADLPYWSITSPLAVAAFPVFARQHRRGAADADLAAELLRLSAVFACPAGILLSATARPLLHVLLGPRWAPAAPALAVLGLWAAVTPVESSLGWFFSSTGRAFATASISGAVLAPLVPVMFVAAHADGIEGIAWTVLASAIVTGAAFAVYAHRRMGFEVSRQLRAVDAVLVACAPAWAAAHFVVRGLVGWSIAGGLVIAIVAGLTVYGLVVYVLRPKVLKGSFAFVSSAMRDLRRGDPTVELT